MFIILVELLESAVPSLVFDVITNGYFFFTCTSVPLLTHLDTDTIGIVNQDEAVKEKIGKLALYVEEQNG